MDPRLDLEMDMTRAAGVGDRLDRAEIVFAGRAGEESPEALKVLVVILLVRVASVDVGAVVVDLPDLDQGVPDRVALGVENTAEKMGHFAHGRSDRVVDDQEVVVGVERELVGIERPLSLRGRPHQFVRE